MHRRYGRRYGDSGMACSRLSRFHDDLNMIAMVGTSDRPCWLAEICKILLLLLLGDTVTVFRAWTLTSLMLHERC